MLKLATLVALVLVGCGPAAAHFHLVSAPIAIGISLTGLSLLGLFFFVAVVRFSSREFSNWFSAVLGFFALVALGTLAFFGRQNPLDDLTTDLKMPPAFVHPAYPFAFGAGSEYLDPSLRLNREFNPSHLAKHEALYPTLTTHPVKVPAKEAYAAILKAVQIQFPAWKIVLDDPEAHHLEAETEEPVFGLITDIVIEVRSSPQNSSESTVVMRSRLRMILTDFGWDAQLLQKLRVLTDSALEPLEDKSLKPQVPPPPAPPAAAPPKEKEQDT
jgi:hypothetical protein